MCNILPRAEWLPESAAAGIAGGREWADAYIYWASNNIESVVTVYDSTLITLQLILKSRINMVWSLSCWLGRSHRITGLFDSFLQIVQADISQQLKL
jgi:hypothetical protein